MMRKIILFCIAALLLFVGVGVYAVGEFDENAEADVQGIQLGESVELNYNYNYDEDSENEDANISFINVFSPEQNGKYQIKVSDIDSANKIYALVNVVDKEQSCYMDSVSINSETGDYDSNLEETIELIAGQNYYICTNINCDDERDSFAGTVNLSIEYVGELDPVVVDENGAQEQQFSSGSMKTIEFTPEDSGEYMVDAYITSDSEGAAYVNEVKTIDGVEVPIAAGICTLEKDQTYYISYGVGEIDTDKVSVELKVDKIATESIPSGGSVKVSKGTNITYEAKTTQKLIVYSVSNGDPFAMAYDEDGMIVAENDDAICAYSDNANDFALVIPAEAGKTYTIYAEDHGDSTFEVKMEKYREPKPIEEVLGDAPSDDDPKDDDQNDTPTNTTQKDIGELKAVLSTTSYTYNGKAKRPDVKITGLTKGTDYSVEYKNNIKAGTAKAVITGKGKYTGSITKTFTIKPASIKTKTVTLSAKLYTYNGKAKRPDVKITGLTKGTDYSVKYSMNTKCGAAAVTITGLGNYAGSMDKHFIIKPAKSKFSKVRPGKKKMTVNITSQKASGVTGYQIYYKKSGSKAKTVFTKSTKKTIKKLKKGKKYTVKVRAYKTVLDKKVYGQYSKPKTIKIK